MVRILKLAQMSATDLATLKRRAELDIDQVIPIAQEVIQAIAQTGNEGLIQYAQKFDYSGATSDNIKVSPEEFTQAQQLVAPEIKRAVDQAFRNIKEVHQRQLPEEMTLAEIDRGVFAGEKITPIPSVGLYVPRGKGAFPSMMLMLTIPAMVAGVKQIVVCTPPDQQGNVEPVSLYVAQMAGVTEVYKLGGIQALAAMALGTTTVPKVDKLTGPCSIYGAAAKRVLFGSVDVGLPAGPSESIILADETTNPQLAALDLLIEAEHGPDSAALLVTHSETVAEKASQFAQEYLKKLPEWRREFCQTGLDAYGGIILTSNLQQSLDFINDYAPEHLEVLVDDPLRLVGAIKNAGEILLGKYTPSSAATYAIGVNAVLPTGGFARSYSAVSVYDFLKRSTVAYLTSEGFDGIKQTSQTLAHYEEFPAHAMAIEERDRLI